MAEPKTGTYSVGVIAKLLMLTEQRVQQLVKQGVIPKAERGRYELIPCVQGYVKYLRDRSAGADVPGDAIGTQRARVMKARADLLEQQAEENAARLIKLYDLLPLVTSIVMRSKQKLLAIPVKAAPLVAVETETEPCRAIIETLIHEALTELASADPRLVGIDFAANPGAGDAGGVGAAAEADSQPMGGSAPKTKPGK